MSTDNLFPHQREIIDKLLAGDGKAFFIDYPNDTGKAEAILSYAREVRRLDLEIATQAIDRLANGAILWPLIDETAVALAKVRDHAERHLSCL